MIQNHPCRRLYLVPNFFLNFRKISFKNWKENICHYLFENISETLGVVRENNYFLLRASMKILPDIIWSDFPKTPSVPPPSYCFVLGHFPAMVCISSSFRFLMAYGCWPRRSFLRFEFQYGELFSQSLPLQLTPEIGDSTSYASFSASGLGLENRGESKRSLSFSRLSFMFCGFGSGHAASDFVLISWFVF